MYLFKCAVGNKKDTMWHLCNNNNNYVDVTVLHSKLELLYSENVSSINSSLQPCNISVPVFFCTEFDMNDQKVTAPVFWENLISSKLGIQWSYLW